MVSVEIGYQNSGMLRKYDRQSVVVGTNVLVV
jgi:hypothetical protein